MVQTRSQAGSKSTPQKRSPSAHPSSSPASAAKKQKKLTPSAQIKDEKKPAPKSTKKPTTTKQAQESPSAQAKADNCDIILINRAPVLHIWAACVTQKLHPALEWETCLSAGAAVSTLCAISKGRAIGVVEPKDDDDSKDSRKKKQHTKDSEELEVMHFKLRCKGGKVFVGEKAQSSGEDGLEKKFGGRYGDVKKAFEDALAGRDDDEEVNGKAFKMYEAFRPDVSKGQKGWGRKGELDLGVVRRVVKEK